MKARFNIGIRIGYCEFKFPLNDGTTYEQANELRGLLTKLTSSDWVGITLYA